MSTPSWARSTTEAEAAVFPLARPLRGFGPFAAVTPPLAPTLAVADEANGGGIVATVTGGSAGATHTLYRQPVDGELGTANWVSTGSRAGNGTISVTVPAGYYWFVVEASLNGQIAGSNLVYLAVTDGADDIQARVVAAVTARIQLLDLDGIAAVYGDEVDPWSQDLELPAVVVTDLDETIVQEGGTTGHDDYLHPVYVVFRVSDGHSKVMVVDGAEVNSANQIRKWAGTVMRSFQSQRLPGVSEVQWCEVEPAEVIAERDGQPESVFSALRIRARTRESRGFGA
jgi:hypothetical protein